MVAYRMSVDNCDEFYFICVLDFNLVLIMTWRTKNRSLTLTIYAEKIGKFDKSVSNFIVLRESDKLD